MVTKICDVCGNFITTKEEKREAITVIIQDKSESILDICSESILDICGKCKEKLYVLLDFKP